jgi:hypothetical protein
MRLMVSGATTTMERLLKYPAARPYLGAMVTPETGNCLERICGWNVDYVVDNSAYNAERFSTRKYLSLLGKVAATPSRPVFVTVPDQAPRREQKGHSHLHGCTSYLFERWFRVLEFEGFDKLPLAFVAQNGLDDVEDVPWSLIEALFIGGDDEFKLGDFVMMDLIPEAKRRGKWTHLGRVNGRRRIRHAVMAGVDSVDGTSMSRFGDTYLHRYVATTALALRERDEMDAVGDALEAETGRLDAGHRAA